MLIEGLASLIPSNPVLQAVLGTPSTRSDGTTGFFPAIAPDEALAPYIVLTQVSRLTELSYQGVNRWQRARFRFSCYGTTYRNTKYLAEDLKQLLDGYVGFLADGTLLENTTPLTEVDDIIQELKATIYSTHVDYEFAFLDNITTMAQPPVSFAFPALVTVPLAPTNPGNFTVAHGIGATPTAVFIQMTSGGSIYLQPVGFDATNLYLTASDAGITGNALVYLSADT